MLRSMLVITAILLSVSVRAQFTISGSIYDATGKQPLSGASILLKENNQGAVSDDQGRFQLTGLNAGSYELLVKYIGFQDKIEKVELTSNVALTISLAEQIRVTDEVIVYATRANDKSPTTFSTVDKQTIQKQNFGQDLPFLLNWTPSLITTSDAGTGIGYTGMRIRGSDATRINVTINGIPYNDSESQGTYWVDIPDVASSTQSIQIQRGVGTSTNGGSAFGASVNLQTNTLAKDPYTELYASGGSFSSQRYTLKTGTGLINNHWAFDGKISKIKSNGYVDRASSDLDSYYFSGGYYGKKTMIKAITFGGKEQTYQSWYGVDAETMKIHRTTNYAGQYTDMNGATKYYDNQVDNYRQDHYQLHFTHQFNENWSTTLAGHYTYGRGYYEEYQPSATLADYGLNNVVLKDTTITTTDLITRKWLDNKFYGTTYSLNYEKGKTHLTIGGAWNQYGHAKHYGEIIWAQYTSNAEIRHRYYNGESKKTDFNIYAKLNYEIGEFLNAYVDLQYRRVDYKSAGIEDGLVPYDINSTFNFFNPKAGLSYTLSEKDVLYSSYAVANREPNRTDYLDNEIKPKPERLGNLEFGWRRNTSHYKLEANYYLMNYKDQLVLTGKLDNVGNPIRANVGKSYRTGVEISGAVQLSAKWGLGINVTRSINRNQDYAYDQSDVTLKKNTAIILSPDWISGSQLTWSAFKNFQATWLSKFVSKQYLDNTQNNNLKLDPYFINDLRFSYHVYPKGIKDIGISFLLNNIFDVKYSSNGAVYGATPYYYPQAGRNFMAMLTLKF